MRILPLQPALTLSACLLLAIPAFAGVARTDTGQTFTGGLVVELGNLDADRLATDHRKWNAIIHGLDSSPAKVAAARRQLRSLGLTGAVSVATFDGCHLPYADNLVNSLVAENLAEVPINEVMRVLVPGGAARIGGKVTVKPVPSAIDSWSHYLHGADNNAVAGDTVVGPPQRAQWIGGPPFSRSHETSSSMAAMVTAGGRLFYIWDEGPHAFSDRSFPNKWSLIARDAFNGTVLWKRPVPEWGWKQWYDPSHWDTPLGRARMLRGLPSTLPRRIVASPDKFFVTLGYHAPVSVLDPATGKTLTELAGTEGTDEILLNGDTLVLQVREKQAPQELAEAKSKRWASRRSRIVSIDTATGKTSWRSKPDDIAPLTLATRDKRVFYFDFENIVCLDLAEGTELWRSPVSGVNTTLGGASGTLVAHDEVVLFAPQKGNGKKDSARLQAFSVKDGEQLWLGPKAAGPGISNAPDLFVASGLVWTGETELPTSHARTELRREGFDILTGKPVREIVVPKLISWGHHYRCYRSKATERFLLLPKRGVEFVDLTGDDHMRHDWLRAPCIYGMLPANGLLYVAPHQCVCYQGVLLSNFNALAPADTTGRKPPTPSQRLTKGPAFGKPAARTATSPENWPAYRHDARRSGCAQTKLPAKLRQSWQAGLTETPSAPVVAGGTLLVAEKDAHTIHALDSNTGKPRWQFTAGGRIDSPPTVHDGLVLFGAADGRVHCLRLSDGSEVWTFLAAPHDRRIMVYGQLESCWPVHGSVLVQQDTTCDPPRPVAYFTAGRSTYLDGGIRVYGLDPATGRIIHQTHLDSPRPDPTTEQGTAGYMDGSKSDLLVSDGTDFFLLQERFRTDLKRIPAPMQNMGKEGGGYRDYDPSPERGSSAVRLITTHGLLEDTDNEGKYWTYGKRWPGWNRKMNKIPSYGQILSFDDDSLYGVHVFTGVNRVRRRAVLGGDGPRLFGRDHDAEKDRWSTNIPIQVRAMVLAGDQLAIAGTPDETPEGDPLAAIEGRRGAVLWTVSSKDGSRTARLQLTAPPVFDGLIAANRKLYLSTRDGRVICYGGE